MSAPYSRLLAEGSGDETDPPSTYLVPPGKVWIVRDIDAYSNPGLVDAVLYVQDISPGFLFAIAKVGIGSQNVVQWRGRQVIDAAGQGLQIESNAGPWTWRVSGYELDA
jgi:hypothetical protein